jgi:diguanylate cyclase (GGDEF)-like protein
MMMLDVDDLKLINDTYGHLVGDQMIEFVGVECRNHLRQADIAARYAGDEFIILLPETDIEGGLCVAGRIRDGISRGIRSMDQHEIPGAVSIGVSSLDPACFSLEMLIDRADGALYASKENGKNQVSFWDNGVYLIYEDPSACDPQ